MAKITQSRPEYGLGFQVKVRRANMAQITQSRPDFGLGFQVKVLKKCCVIPSSLGSSLGTYRVREGLA